MAPKTRKKKVAGRRPADPNSFILRALAHASADPGGDFAQFEVAGPPRRLSTGWRVVPLQQFFCGVPVLHGVRAVRFNAAGKIAGFTGSTIEVPERTPIEPTTSAAEAARVAFLELARRGSMDGRLTFSAAAPVSIAELGPPTYTAVLRKDPLEDAILAALVIDASGRAPRLVWEVRVRLPEGGEGYIIRVDAAGRGPVPIVREVIPASATAVEGRVFEFDPRTPAVSVPFPRELEHYPRWPTSRPPRLEWVVGGETRGNNARVVVRGQCIRASAKEDGLVFEPAPEASLDAAAVNAFHLCNFLHDFFYLLGFDERAGNFQAENATSEKGAGDAVEVLIQDREILGMGAFANRTDGKHPTLQLGFHSSGRHAAFDAHLVIHEFAHGVTNRLVGTNLNLHTPLQHEQSIALGEGLSDYWAISIQNYYRRRAARAAGLDPVAAQEWAFAPWLSSGGATGLRSHAYDAHPGTYGSLRRHPMDVHTAGEVWCATLLDLHGVLGGGDLEEGDERGWRLSFDSLGFLHPGPKGPHFLHARNAILCAYDALAANGTLPADAGTRQSLFDAFRSRGMGGDAKSDDGRFRSVEEGSGAIGDDYKKSCK